MGREWLLFLLMKLCKSFFPAEFKSYTVVILQTTLLTLFFSVAELCLTLFNPMDCSMTGLPVIHHLPELHQTHIHWVSNAIQPSHPLFPLCLLPSIFPGISVFSNESALFIRWPKYWSFSSSISPTNEYSGLISLGWTGWISS